MTTTTVRESDHPELAIIRIKSDAADATLKYSTVDEACPYPFGTFEANLFIAAFTAERDRQNEHIVKDAFADVGQRANPAFITIAAEMQHPNSIKSDALIDTSDTTPQSDAESENALQTAFATAILAGADNIQPIDAP